MGEEGGGKDWIERERRQSLIKIYPPSTCLACPPPFFLSSFFLVCPGINHCKKQGDNKTKKKLRNKFYLQLRSSFKWHPCNLWTPSSVRIHSENKTSLWCNAPTEASITPNPLRSSLLQSIATRARCYVTCDVITWLDAFGFLLRAFWVMSESCLMVSRDYSKR